MLVLFACFCFRCFSPFPSQMYFSYSNYMNTYGNHMLHPLPNNSLLLVSGELNIDAAKYLQSFEGTLNHLLFVQARGFYPLFFFFFV